MPTGIPLGPRKPHPKLTADTIYDYEAVKFDVRGYIKSLKNRQGDIAHTLRVNLAQMQMWMSTGKMPKSVQRYAFKLWGQQGFPEPPTIKQKRPYILNAELYGPYVKANLGKHLQFPTKVAEPQAPPAPPPPPPLPDAIARDVFETAVSLLLYQNAQVLAESAIVNARNTELENRVAFLENQQGMTRTLTALEGVRREPPRQPSDRAVALDFIKRSNAASNGGASAVSELEKRLSSFPSGPRA